MNDYQKGEDFARKCLEVNGLSVIDRRQSPAYWKKDIDLTAIKDGRKEEIEVKYTDGTTGTEEIDDSKMFMKLSSFFSLSSVDRIQTA